MSAGIHFTRVCKELNYLIGPENFLWGTPPNTSSMNMKFIYTAFVYILNYYLQTEKQPSQACIICALTPSEVCLVCSVCSELKAVDIYMESFWNHASANVPASIYKSLIIHTWINRQSIVLHLCRPVHSP